MNHPTQCRRPYSTCLSIKSARAGVPLGSRPSASERVRMERVLTRSGMRLGLPGRAAVLSITREVLSPRGQDDATLCGVVDIRVVRRPASFGPCSGPISAMYPACSTPQQSAQEMACGWKGAACRDRQVRSSCRSSLHSRRPCGACCRSSRRQPRTRWRVSPAPSCDASWVAFGPILPATSDEPEVRKRLMQGHGCGPRACPAL